MKFHKPGFCTHHLAKVKFQITSIMTDFRPEGITLFGILSSELINITIIMRYAVLSYSAFLEWFFRYKLN